METNTELETRIAVLTDKLEQAIQDAKASEMMLKQVCEERNALRTSLEGWKGYDLTAQEAYGRLRADRDELRQICDGNRDDLIAILEKHGLSDKDKLADVIAGLSKERDAYKAQWLSLPLYLRSPPSKNL